MNCLEQKRLASGFGKCATAKTEIKAPDCNNFTLMEFTLGLARRHNVCQMFCCSKAMKVMNILMKLLTPTSALKL